MKPSGCCYEVKIRHTEFSSLRADSVVNIVVAVFIIINLPEKGFLRLPASAKSPHPHTCRIARRRCRPDVLLCLPATHVNARGARRGPGAPRCRHPPPPPLLSQLLRVSRAHAAQSDENTSQVPSVILRRITPDLRGPGRAEFCCPSRSCGTAPRGGLGSGRSRTCTRAEDWTSGGGRSAPLSACGPGRNMVARGQ